MPYCCVLTVIVVIIIIIIVRSISEGESLTNKDGKTTLLKILWGVGGTCSQTWMYIRIIWKAWGDAALTTSSEAWSQSVLSGAQVINDVIHLRSNWNVQWKIHRGEEKALEQEPPLSIVTWRCESMRWLWQQRQERSATVWQLCHSFGRLCSWLSAAPRGWQGWTWARVWYSKSSRLETLRAVDIHNSNLEIECLCLSRPYYLLWFNL